MTSSTPAPIAPVVRPQQASVSSAPPVSDAPPPAATPPDSGFTDEAGWGKAALDFGLALVLFILFAPVMLIAAAAIRVTSAGPAFYTQTRLGLGGRPFRIIKLRTMYHNCEKASGVKWSTPGDSRITRLGKFLRATHLDELPQLINVLRGEMSLVGPRPERPEITPALETAIPNYRQRLRVRPGVTGLAQLRLPADTCVSGVTRKLAYDLHYIHTFGLWLDLRLMACTAFKMTGIPLTRVLDLCRVPGPEAAGLKDEPPSNKTSSRETRTHTPFSSSNAETREKPPLPPKG